MIVARARIYIQETKCCYLRVAGCVDRLVAATSCDLWLLV